MVAITPRVVTRLIQPLSRISRDTTNLTVNRCFETFKPAMDNYIVPAVEKLSDVPVRVHNAMANSDHKLARLYKEAYTTASTVFIKSDKDPVAKTVNALGDLVGGLPSNLSTQLHNSKALATEYCNSHVKPVVGKAFLFTAKRVVFPVLSEAFELAKPYIRSMVPTNFDDLFEVYSMKLDPPIIDIALAGSGNIEADTSFDTTLIDLEGDKVQGPDQKFSSLFKPEDIKKHEAPKLELDGSFFTGDDYSMLSLLTSPVKLRPRVDRLSSSSQRRRDALRI